MRPSNLDFYFDILTHEDDDNFQGKVRIWNGPTLISDKVWYSDNASALWNMARVHYLAVVASMDGVPVSEPKKTQNIRSQQMDMFRTRDE